MGTLNRRDVIRTAAGAALVGGVTRTGAGQVPAVAPSAEVAGRRPPRGRRHLAAAPVAVPEGNPPRLASVAMCRSWTREVHLTIDAGTCGFVELSLEGFAVAASCQAAGRPVAVRYWGHEPAARRGLGAFAGAMLAFDLDDLPAAADEPQA